LAELWSSHSLRNTLYFITLFLGIECLVLTRFNITSLEIGMIADIAAEFRASVFTQKHWFAFFEQSV